MHTTVVYRLPLRANMYGWLHYTVAETNWGRASVVYCSLIIGCQGVLLWACQALSSRPNWLVCSFPPKGPELNLLVMASISWLDKIPPNSSPLHALSLSLSIHSLLKSCHLISLLNRGGSCPVLVSAFHPVLFIWTFSKAWRRIKRFLKTRFPGRVPIYCAAFARQHLNQNV